MAAVLWPRQNLVSAHALLIALQEQLSLTPRLKHAVGRDTGSLFHSHTSLPGVSTAAVNTKPSLCKCHARAEALGAAPAISGSALGEPLLPLQSLCRYVYEDPYCPPHLLRKAYAEKLKERLQKKERCSSPTRQRPPEEQAELPHLQTAWEV